MSRFLARAAMLGIVTIGFAGAAQAATMYNNITVYDDAHRIVGRVTGDFVASPSRILYLSGVAIDASRFGDPSGVFNAGSGTYVNIFGIASGGPDGSNLALGGAASVSAINHSYTFNGAPISATDYLAPGLRSAGYTAFITVAGVPEPASWALLIAGFGLVGAAQRRRNKAQQAA